jgi:hypothetical protein
LRDAGSNPETIARNAWLFGLDTQPLAKLAQAAATVSPELGRAVQLASITAPAASTAKAVTQAPVLTRAAENVSPLSLTAQTTEKTTAPAVVEPVVTTKKEDQATSPSLQQVLQEAAANAFSHLDSATYLNTLFKG